MNKDKRLLINDSSIIKIYNFSKDSVYDKTKKEIGKYKFTKHINNMLNEAILLGFNENQLLYSIILHDIFEEAKKVIETSPKSFFEELLNLDSEFNKKESLDYHIGIFSSFLLTDNFFKKEEFNIKNLFEKFGYKKDIFSFNNNDNFIQEREKFLKKVFDYGYSNFLNEENKVSYKIENENFLNKKDIIKKRKKIKHKNKKEHLMNLIQNYHFLPVLIKAFDTLDNTRVFKNFQKGTLETKLFQLNKINDYLNNVLKQSNGNKYINLNSLNNLNYKIKIKYESLYNLNKKLYDKSEEIIHYVALNKSISLKRIIQDTYN